MSDKRSKSNTKIQILPSCPINTAAIITSSSSPAIGSRQKIIIRSY